jgi:hypothetical protein
MQRAVVVKADDWEGLYVGGKLVDEGHTLNEGEERIIYFLQLADKYKFDLKLTEFISLSDEMIQKVEEEGNLPENLHEALGLTYGDRRE